jgi:hypothetical protein
MEKFGKTLEEKHAEDMHKCREIVSEILKFGVNESQKKQIIYLLSLELENRDTMLSISNLIKEKKNEPAKLLTT